MDYALIVYPLSDDYREKFEAITKSKPHYLSLSELRRLPLKKLIRSLREMKGGRFLIPIEDVNAQTLLPVLQCLAAMSSVRSIEIFYPDGQCNAYSRWRVWRAPLDIIFASVASVVSALRSGLEIAMLDRKQRIQAKQKTGGILYLKTNLWFGVKAGGSVGHVAGVINALLDKGNDVQVAAVDAPPLLKPASRFIGLSLPKYYGIPTELNLYRFQQLQVRDLLRINSNVSFIYQRLSMSNYAGVVLSRRWQVPLVIEYNGSEAWIAKNWGTSLKFHDLAVSAEKICLKHAHLIVTISDVLKDELVEWGVDPGKIVVYPNCIDPETFSPEHYTNAETISLRERYGIKPDSILLTFIGTFGMWHGADILADAIARLYSEEREWLIKNKVHFMLVGDGLKMPQVRQTIDRAGASAICSLTGLVAQDKAPLYLAASDIFISPHVSNSDGSRFFGSPTKLFEYMAMGKGIVASRLDQIADVLTPGLDVSNLPDKNPCAGDNQLAVLCKPGDVNELIRGIKFLVENAEWREKIGRNARQRALEKYTWEHHVDAILNGLRSYKI